MQLDPEDVNDIIDALEKIDFERFIVLEDFHYLPEETQKSFAVALKAFHESSTLRPSFVGFSQRMAMTSISTYSKNSTVF